MKAIEIMNLTKTFKERTAVDSLSLSIDKGEFFSLLGENGAGKTTTIKMLSCLLSPTSGDAKILGDSIITDSSKVKQKLNLSPQETAVAPNLTVEENLKLIAGIYDIKKSDIQCCVDNMLETFKLVERKNDKAKILSGGMQRRLSIAMALITNPKVIFLDEPTLGLDVRARRDMWNVLKSLKGKITIILTTHYLEESEALSDRIGVIHRGNLCAVGTLDELKKKTKENTLEDIFIKLTDGGVA